MNKFISRRKIHEACQMLTDYRNVKEEKADITELTQMHRIETVYNYTNFLFFTALSNVVRGVDGWARLIHCFI